MKKIPTLFVRDFEPPSKGRLVLPQVTPGCEWVLQGYGYATRKYDGVCTMVDEKGILWKRREVRPGQNQPSMFVQVDFDETTGKYVGWVPVDLNDPADKWMVIAPEPGTYEFLGPKSQGNVERFDTHTLLRHGATLLPDVPCVSEPQAMFDLLRGYLEQHDYEGIVWHGGPDGAMAKIKARDFGLNRHGVRRTADSGERAERRGARQQAQ